MLENSPNLTKLNYRVHYMTLKTCRDEIRSIDKFKLFSINFTNTTNHINGSNLLKNNITSNFDSVHLIVN